jgi:hypothetical protein
MTRARANPGRAANRPMAPTSGASLPLDASLLSIVANLEGLDLDGLRRQWRAHLGGEPPAHLSRWLLMKVLAHRLQSDAFGDLDKSIGRILRSGKEGGVGAPFDRRVPQTREGLGLKVGALLMREWNGRLERVMILEEGFAWNGQTFGSLSQIAKLAIKTQIELTRPSLTENGPRWAEARDGLRCFLKFRYAAPFPSDASLVALCDSNVAFWCSDSRVKVSKCAKPTRVAWRPKE